MTTTTNGHRTPPVRVPPELLDLIVEAMLAKRVVVRLAVERIRSWDHRRLGMSTVELGGTTAAYCVARARATAGESWPAAAARWITAEEFPRAVRVGSAAGEIQDSAYDPTSSFRFGLDRILDGLQALIDRRVEEPGE